jgi:hypothetical protein
MKIPDENHPITLERERTRVQVLFEGHEIADSGDVLVLTEAGYPPVRYFPREDVQMMFLRRTDKITHCPYKGDASYFTIYRDRQIIENAAGPTRTLSRRSAASAGASPSIQNMSSSRSARSAPRTPRRSTGKPAAWSNRARSLSALTPPGSTRSSVTPTAARAPARPSTGRPRSMRPMARTTRPNRRWWLSPIAEQARSELRREAL